MKITRAHGNGGKQTAELLEKIFFPNFASEFVIEPADAAGVQVGGAKIGHTIDGFVVKPFIFEGGDIGKLSICGTVNDLAVSGYRPQYISASFVIEEGFDIEDLEHIVHSMRDTAKLSEVAIVAGDTKVVEKGAVDKIFITTAGIGAPYDANLSSFKNIKKGQSLLVSGDIGRHGACIYSHNSELGLKTAIRSDCEPLNAAVEQLKVKCSPAFMRDLTRGGLATALNEIAAGANCELTIREASLPIAPEVAGLCDILGLDPLYLACEGRMAVIVESELEQQALSILQQYHREAAVIGTVSGTGTARVLMTTHFQGTRVIDMLYYEMLPRIC